METPNPLIEAIARDRRLLDARRPIIRSVPQRAKGAGAQWLLAAVVLAALIALVISLYVSAEQIIYHWDEAVYHDMSMAKAIELRESDLLTSEGAVRALKKIRRSFAEDYSDLHALPVAPPLLLFGESRQVYILSLGLLYLLPYILLTGAAASRLAPDRARWATGAALLLAAALPVAWLPTLRGYPDAGAAALTVLAIWAYLSSPQLPKLWQPVLMGLSMASAILFRRHYLYETTVIFGAAGLVAMVEFGIAARKHRAIAFRAFVRQALRLSLAIAVLVAVMLTVGRPFVARLLTTDFRSLYASYEMPPLTNLAYYAIHYGWLALAVALAGLVWSARREQNRPAALFVLFGGCLAFLQWILFVRQLGVHYPLHFTTWVVLGLTAAALGVRDAVMARMPALSRTAHAGLIAPVVLLLLGSAWVGLSGLGSSEPGPRLFPERFPPRISRDGAEIQRLLETLRSQSGVPRAGGNGPARGTIYVAASSAALSDDLLWHADRASSPGLLSTSSDRFWEAGSLNILHWTPFADSRDPFPLEKLVAADFVVLAEPVQYHMRPGEQRVVSVVVEAFSTGWPIAQDFVRLPMTFAFSGGVRVSLYRRMRPTSTETALTTLRQMEAFHGGRPGGQLPWLSLSPGAESWVSRSGPDACRIASGYRVAPPELRYLYIDRLPPTVEVHGNARFSSPECGGQSLRLEAIDRGGKILALTESVLPFGREAEFLLELAAPDAEGLMLRQGGLEQAGEGKCWLEFNQVRVRPGKIEEGPARMPPDSLPGGQGEVE
jgi:hypothetical protein